MDWSLKKPILVHLNRSNLLLNVLMLVVLTGPWSKTSDTSDDSARKDKAMDWIGLSRLRTWPRRPNPTARARWFCDCRNCSSIRLVLLVQRPMLAMFLCLVTLTFELLTQNRKISRTYCGTFVEHLCDASFLRYRT